MDAYRFNTSFERNVIWYAMTAQSFAKFLPYFDKELFASDETKTIAAILRAWGNETPGTVPGSIDILLQRMEREYGEGRLAAEAKDAAEGWLWELLLTLQHPLPVAGVEAELRSTLVSFTQFRAAEDLVRQSRARGSMSKAAKRIIDAESIGIISAKPRLLRNAEDFRKVMKSQGSLDRLATGTVVDTIIGGGLPLHNMALILANTNVGKSQLLLQFVAACLIQGKNACVTLLEGTESQAIARLFAILSGKNVLDVRADFDAALDAVACRWPNLGQISIWKMDAVGSTAADITAAWDEDAKARGLESWDLCGLDYLDLVEGGEVQLPPSTSDYQRAKVAARYFSNYVTSRKTRIWSPTQSQRLAKDVETDMTINSGADSHHKARITDVMIGINKKKKPPPTSPWFMSYGPKDVFLDVMCLKNRDEQAGLRSDVVRAELWRAVVLPNQTYFSSWEDTVYATESVDHP